MFDGYVRRYERLEDLFIINCAMPTMRGPVKKPPSYKKLTAYRKSRAKIGEIEEDVQEAWREILIQGGIQHAKKHGDQAGD